MRRVAPAIVLGILSATAVASQTSLPGPSDSTGVIRGRVLSSDGTPLRHARVQVMTGSGASDPVVLTNADGRFVLSGLKPGAYRLSATKAGFAQTTFGATRYREPGTPIAVSGRAVVDGVEIRMPRGAAFSGRLLDAQGDPIVGMAISAEMQTPGANGRGPATTPVATTRTDDLGEYRLGGLPAGAFIIDVDVTRSIVAPNGIAVDGPLQLTAIVDGRPTTFTTGPPPTPTRLYFPGVSTLAEAQAVTLSAGDERTSVDFLVPMAPAPVTVNQFLEDRIRAGQRVLATYQSGIEGRVLAADGRPLSQAMVRLSSDQLPGLPPSAITDAAGHYQFSKLPSGSYHVTASRAGYISLSYGQRRLQDEGAEVELRPNEMRDHIDVALPVPGAVAGRVLDETGDPVEGAIVRVWAMKYEAGRKRLVDAGGQGSHRTDDQGRYRVYGLLPGDYFVSAVVGQIIPGQSFSDVPGYAPTYFPSTSNPADARPLRIDLARQILDVDVGLVNVPTARISGAAFDSEGNPVQGSINLSPSRRSGSLMPMVVGARTSRTGAFDFPNVPPGEYVVQVTKSRSRPTAEGEFASLFVTVNGTDVTGLVIRMSKGSSASGRIRLEGRAERQFYSLLDIRAVPLDMDRSPLVGNQPASAAIAADLTFAMDGLSGSRVFRLQPRKGWTLKAVLLNGRDITDTPLTFGTDAQSLSDLEIVLSDRVTEASGTVTDARGRSLASLPVVIFSTDRQWWSVGSRYVATGKTAGDGTFSVMGLPPGEYFAVATDELASGEGEDPEVLDTLATGATRVTLSEGQKSVMTVKVLAR